MTGQQLSPRALKGYDGDDNHVLGSVGGVPQWKSPSNIGILAYSLTGSFTAGAGTVRLYNDTGRSWTIVAARATVATAPASTSAQFNVKVNGTTAITSSPITVPASANTSGKITAITTPTVADGQYLTVDVVAASGAADLTLTLVVS